MFVTYYTTTNWEVLFREQTKLRLTLAIRNVMFTTSTSFSYVLLRLKGYTNPGQAAPEV